MRSLTLNQFQAVRELVFDNKESDVLPWLGLAFDAVNQEWVYSSTCQDSRMLRNPGFIRILENVLYDDGSFAVNLEYEAEDSQTPWKQTYWVGENMHTGDDGTFSSADSCLGFGFGRRKDKNTWGYERANCQEERPVVCMRTPLGK